MFLSNKQLALFGVMVLFRCLKSRQEVWRTARGCGDSYFFVGMSRVCSVLRLFERDKQD